MTRRQSGEELRVVGLIGDIHGQVVALDRALRALATYDVDRVVCVGDIADTPVEIETCLRLLMQSDVVMVRGNHDRWLLEAAAGDPDTGAALGRTALEFLASVPPMRLLNTRAGTAMLCHGIGSNDLAHVPVHFADAFLRRARRIGTIPKGCVAMLRGHTHSFSVISCTELLVVTAGQLSEDASSGCALVNFDDKTAEKITY